MSAFDDAFETLIGHEGGYTHHPEDPGGETKYGITKRCLAPNCRVLTADLRWVMARDVRQGDALLGFDEHPARHGKLNLRRFRAAVVEDAGPVRLPASVVTTSARSFVVSDDHQWLRRWGEHRVFEWSRTADLLRPKGKWTNGVTVRLGAVFDPWDVVESRAAGYLAGVLDGEGSISQQLVFHQKRDGALVEQALRCAAELGLEFREENVRSNNVAAYRLVNSRSPFDHIAVVGKLGAERLLKIAAARIVGKSIASKYARHDEVLSVEPVGEQDLVGISTSTKTLIAEGYLSHNSYPKEDIRGMTLERAKAIYRRDYWDKVHGDDWPYVLAFQLFDAAVNSGPSQAVKWLQAAVGTTQDGKLGPITWAAVQALPPSVVAARMTGHRLIAMTDMRWSTFGKGWARRIGANLVRMS